MVCKTSVSKYIHSLYWSKLQPLVLEDSMQIFPGDSNSLIIYSMMFFYLLRKTLLRRYWVNWILINLICPSLKHSSICQLPRIVFYF